MRIPLLLALTALLFDVGERQIPFSVLGTGLLDEPAHVATAALGLLAVAPVVWMPRGFVVAALVASVAIDLDHAPLYLGARWVAVGMHGRPFTHSLTTVVVLTVGAWVLRSHRFALAGAAVGVVLHLARDVMEGPPGVSLLWPVDDHAWMTGPAAWVGLVLALLVVRGVLLARGLPPARRSSGERQGDAVTAGEGAHVCCSTAGLPSSARGEE